MVKRTIFFIASVILVALATVEFQTLEVVGQTEEILSLPPVEEVEPALNMETLPEQESFSQTSSVQSLSSVEKVPVVAKRVSPQPVSRALWPKYLLAPDIASGNLDDQTLAFLKYEQGLTKFQSGHYKEAFEAFNKSLKLNPDQAEFYFLRGGLHWHTKDYEAAISDFTTAIDFGMETNEAYYFRGRAYMENQEFEAADADLTRAIELNTDDGYAHFYRWETRNRLKQYMDAVEDAHRALDIDNSTFYPHIFGTHRCDVDGCGSVQNHIEPHRHVVTLPEDHHNSSSELPEHRGYGYVNSSVPLSAIR